MAKAKKAQPKVSLKVGDHVLLVGTRASLPADWYLGTILWIGDGDLLVERYTLNGHRWRQLATVLDVRATGSIQELVVTQEEARKRVQHLRESITKAESLLGSARDEMWAEVERMADDGVKVIPPDFRAMDDEDARHRAAIEAHEEAQAA